MSAFTQQNMSALNCYPIGLWPCVHSDTIHIPLGSIPDTVLVGLGRLRNRRKVSFRCRWLVLHQIYRGIVLGLQKQLFRRKAAKKQNSKEVSIYGQEVNGSSVAMAKMNMYIHEIRDAKIAWGDTLANPLFLDSDGNLLLFDAIVANMPFSKDKWASGFNPGGESSGKGKKEFKMEASLDKFHRFDWGVPPASKGDWAFLLHMIASLSVNGRIAAVAPHGVLFRGAAEGRIRQKVIEENLLDAVIGLPENLFYGTPIPACILVFKKNRPNTDVLFIDASKKDEDGNPRYIKASNQNELGQTHIDAIIQAYQDRTEKDRFAHVATLDEIRENEYNLNIPRYVDAFEEEEPIDIQQVQSNIARLKAEITEAEKQMDAYLKELGL